MPPPTPLSVATNATTRLLKEESSYRSELASQQLRLRQLRERHAGGGGGDGADDEDGDDEGEAGNWAFRIRQEEQAVQETKAVFGPLRERVRGAVERLEGLLASGGNAEGPEVDAANDALVRARATM